MCPSHMQQHVRRRDDDLQYVEIASIVNVLEQKDFSEIIAELRSKNRNEFE